MKGMDKQPMAEALEQAACEYYNVTPDFFRVKLKDGNTNRRRVLFWLLVDVANLYCNQVAKRYGYRRSSIYEGVKVIDGQRSVEQSIARDIAKIKEMVN